MSFKDVIKALTFKDILEGIAESILAVAVIYVICVIIWTI